MFYGALIDVKYHMLILDFFYYKSFDESIFALRVRLFFSTVYRVDLLCLVNFQFKCNDI